MTGQDSQPPNALFFCTNQPIVRSSELLEYNSTFCTYRFRLLLPDSYRTIRIIYAHAWCLSRPASLPSYLNRSYKPMLMPYPYRWDSHPVRLNHSYKSMLMYAYKILRRRSRRSYLVSPKGVVWTMVFSDAAGYVSFLDRLPFLLRLD